MVPTNLLIKLNYLLNSSFNSICLKHTWPAQHDWLRRYFVFERATYALEEIVAAGMCIYFNWLQRKNATVQ